MNQTFTLKINNAKKKKKKIIQNLCHLFSNTVVLHNTQLVYSAVFTDHWFSTGDFVRLHSDRGVGMWGWQ